jgi:hypothetical protein
VVISFSSPMRLAEKRLWWLVVENRTADLCRDDQVMKFQVIVESTVRALTEIWTTVTATPTGDPLWRTERARRWPPRSGPMALARPQHVRADA